MPDTISLKLPLLVAEQAQKHVTHNEALRALDALVQLSVKDRDLAAPPGAPAEGDRYIVAASPTGAWAGRAADIAVFQDNAWDFHDPLEGWRCWVEDENVFLIFDGSAWVDWGAALGALQNLSLLGVGTTADATNRFSAKLNKALWTARTAAEGGDGDLRYTMNKEAAADVLSLLLQRGFSGRAEIGLIGDDDLTIKVSPDGSVWVTALVVDKDDGSARLPAGSSSAPALTLGQAGLGLYRSAADTLGLAWPAGATFTWSAASFSWRSPAAPVSISIASSNSAIFNDRGSADASGAQWITRKARGDVDSPATVSTNDQLGLFSFRGYGASTYIAGAQYSAVCIETSPSNSAMGARHVFSACAIGSSSLTEIARLDVGAGLSMFGANPVIDQNRHLRLRSYTVATLPSASPAGQMIYVSDGTSNKRMAVSDGTNWRFPDGNVVS